MLCFPLLENAAAAAVADADAASSPVPAPATVSPPCSIATKWDFPRGELRNKRRHPIGDNTEARAHWTVAYAMPTMEG